MPDTYERGVRMDLAGYVINAVLVEGQKVNDVCAAHGISRSWLYELIARYREQGEVGLKPRSKRPRSSPTRLPAVVEDEIVAVRKGLAEGRLGCRATDDPGPAAAAAPGTSASGGAVGGDDLASPGPPGLHRPATPEATQELLAAFPGRTTQGMLAGRPPPLAARR